MSDFTPLPDNFWFVRIPLVDGSGQTRPPEDRAEMETWQRALKTLRQHLVRYKLRPCISMVKDVIDHGGLAHVTVTAQCVILRLADFTAVAYDIPTEPSHPFSETGQETHSTTNILLPNPGIPAPRPTYQQTQKATIAFQEGRHGEGPVHLPPC